MDSQSYESLYDLRPEDFQWLDLAEEFFKHDGSFSYGQSRKVPRREDGGYDDIESELEQLNNLYEASPDHVLEPLMPIYRDTSDGEELAGFYMERFEGVDIRDYLQDLGDEKSIMEGLDLVREIEDTVEGFHSQGLVHGDLANNIMYDGERFVIFDPVGVPKTSRGFEDMRNLDVNDVDILESDAKAPFHNTGIFD